MMKAVTVPRRAKHNKGQTCVFCGCYSTEADIKRVMNESRETEFVCTDCLSEPETDNWMKAGGYSVRQRNRSKP